MTCVHRVNLHKPLYIQTIETCIYSIYGYKCSDGEYTHSKQWIAINKRTIKVLCTNKLSDTTGKVEDRLH